MRSPSKRTVVGTTCALLLLIGVALPAAFAAASTGNTSKAAETKEFTGSTLHRVTPPSASWGNTKCFGLYPATGEKSYSQNCYGHDEPAIDPISSVPGTGQDVTWTIKLPRSRSQQLLNLGPTFWVGATLSDKSSLADSVFSELQFYPDSSLLPQTGTDINTACTQFGFNVQSDPGTWSVCDFSWALYPSQGNFFETPAYVGVLDTSTNANQPLYLHSGDVIRVHIHPSGDANNDAEQTITDVTTGQSGSLIMNSNATTGAGSVANPTTGDGPLTLPYLTNTTNNAMPWGVVDGTPFAFSWEIGHSNFYTHPFQGECVPGQWDCQSYDVSNSGWGGVDPFQIMSVTFDVNGQTVDPSSWATNDSQGGAAEDDLWCGGFNVSGTTLCNFPYYTYDPHTNTIDFGTTYPSAMHQVTYGGSAAQYAQQATCNGPLTASFGFLYYCDTTLSPNPPIP